MVVDWVNRKIQINAPHLQQLLNAIRRLLESFTCLIISHIYKELNSEADRLSKLTLLLDPGKLETEESTENSNRIYNRRCMKVKVHEMMDYAQSGAKQGGFL